MSTPATGSGAQIAPEGAGWVVTCALHDWRWHVETEGHATNLMRKHDREWEHPAPDGIQHPDTFDLSGAADYVLVCLADHDDDPNPDHGRASYYTALDLWERLTGLTGAAALDYARAIRETSTRATTIPF